MDAIDSCNCLFLTSLTESAEGGIQLVAQEGLVSSSLDENVLAEKYATELATLLKSAVPIKPGPSCRVFTFYWPSYIAYAVENESYATNCPTDERVGRLFRTYSKSAYLDYLSNSTFASPGYPGPFRHWAVVCADHVVNVASTEEPIITASIA